MLVPSINDNHWSVFFWHNLTFSMVMHFIHKKQIAVSFPNFKKLLHSPDGCQRATRNSHCKQCYLLCMPWGCKWKLTITYNNRSSFKQVTIRINWNRCMYIRKKISLISSYLDGGSNPTCKNHVCHIGNMSLFHPFSRVTRFHMFQTTRKSFCVCVFLEMLSCSITFTWSGFPLAGLVELTFGMGSPSEPLPAAAMVLLSCTKRYHFTFWGFGLWSPRSQHILHTLPFGKRKACKISSFRFVPQRVSILEYLEYHIISQQ